MAAGGSPPRRGWFYNKSSARLEARFNNTAFLRGTASAATLPLATTASAGLTVATSFAAPGLVTEAALTTSATLGLGAMRVGHWAYSFATDGGVRTGIVMRGGVLPQGAVITGGFMYVKTAPVGPTNASIQLVGANDIVNSAAISGAPWSTATAKTVIVPVVATANTWVQTTTAAQVPTVIGTVADFSAGAFEIFLQYYVLSNV